MPDEIGNQVLTHLCRFSTNNISMRDIRTRMHPIVMESYLEEDPPFFLTYQWRDWSTRLMTV